MEIIKTIKNKGLTDADIAAALGVSTKTVNNWEKGIFEPRPEKLRKLEELANDSIVVRKGSGYDERGLMNEALLRTTLYQVAEIKAHLLGRKVEDVLKEVNEDALEVLNNLKLKIGRP